MTYYWKNGRLYRGAFVADPYGPSFKSKEEAQNWLDSKDRDYQQRFNFPVKKSTIEDCIRGGVPQLW